MGEQHRWQGQPATAGTLTSQMARIRSPWQRATRARRPTSQNVNAGHRRSSLSGARRRQYPTQSPTRMHRRQEKLRHPRQISYERARKAICDFWGSAKVIIRLRLRGLLRWAEASERMNARPAPVQSATKQRDPTPPNSSKEEQKGCRDL